MESAACNLCGGTHHSLVWNGEDWAYGFPGQFTLVRCEACGLAFLNPRPTRDEIGSFYPADYEPHRRASRALRSKFSNQLQQWRFRPRVRVVTRYVTQGRLLDVGCGDGGFLREMGRRPGWDVQGVEVNAEVARLAREQLGVDVVAGRLEDARFEDGCFDVVTMWDVLEHVHDPLATLDEVHRVLAPGGCFICSTPNADSIDARLFGRFWIGLDFPRHLYVFSPSTLLALLRKSGLQPEASFCFYGRYTAFALSVSQWINARISDRKWQHRLSAALQFPLWRYLTLPYFLALDALRLGSIITVCARRAC
jgi:SAM-dependent methyltransferase